MLVGPETSILCVEPTCDLSVRVNKLIYLQGFQCYITCLNNNQQRQKNVFAHIISSMSVNSRCYIFSYLCLYCRRAVLSANCPVGELSCRRHVLSANCPVGEVSVIGLSVGELSVGEVSVQRYKT